MSAAEEAEDVHKNKRDRNAAVSGALKNSDAGEDYIEFSADEETNDQVSIKLPKLNQPLGDHMLLRSANRVQQLPNHPLADGCAQEHARQRHRAMYRKYAPTREKNIENHFKINSKDTWTFQERSDLIEALKKHGIFDRYNICKEVPTKTQSQISEFIEAAQSFTQNSLDGKMNGESPSTEQDNPIAQWLYMMEASATEQRNRFTAYNLMLPKVFLYISKYGNHPDPASSGGIDYRDAYEYMYYMLSGQPGKDLTPETSRFVRKTLLNLSFRARAPSDKHTDFIRSIEGTAAELAQQQNSEASTVNWVPDCCKTPAGKMQQKALQEIGKMPDANPLNVPMKLLEIRKHKTE